MTTKLLLAFAILGVLTVAGVIVSNLPSDEQAPIVVAWGGGGRR